MEKKLKICGKEYDAKVSVITLLKFYDEFGKDFGETLGNINDRLVGLTKEKEADGIAYVKNFGAIVVDATRLAYVMIKEKDPTFKDYDEWVSELDGVYDDMTWISEVIKLGFCLFRRTLSQ